MRLAELLRLTALGVAVLCVLDPPVIVTPVPLLMADAAIVRSARDARPATDEGRTTVVEEARRLASALSDALASAGTVRIHEVSAGDRLPCDAQQPCVVITEGAALSIPEDRKGPVSIVPVGAPLSPNVELQRLSVAPAHAAGQATAAVSLAGTGLKGHESRVRLFDGDAVVGEAAHTWTADGVVVMAVPWWPVAAGERTLIARASTAGVQERTDLDNDMATTASVEEIRWPVLVLERRASWAATFVRRAIEADARFEVAVLADVAPGVSVSTTSRRPLDDLDHVRVVVVGGPEALTKDDVDRLDRFVRQRGGAIVLLPDRPITGPATRLVHHQWRERVEPEAKAAGSLRASEWLLAVGVGPLDDVWGRSAEGATVVATPVGAGVVVISGALDAWRHRGADGAHDRFWRASVARLASAVGPAVALQLDGDESGPSEDLTARLTTQTMRPTDAWRVTASRTCGDGPAERLRLWPADAAGAFEGRVPIGARTACRIDAQVAGLGGASASLAAGEASSRYPRWDQPAMQSLAMRTRGQYVEDGDVRPIVQAWLQTRPNDRRPEPRYPMRSWWWVLPFVASLSGEWWLRRRAGLR